MAAEDFGDKTHDATPYRRQKAREEGQVVRSQDLASAGLLVAGLLVLWYFSGNLANFLGRLTRDHLGGQAWLTFDTQATAHLSFSLAVQLAITVLPILGFLLVGAILTHLGQFGFLYLPQKVALDWQRLNPLSNAQRIFSLTNLVHLGFGLLKVLL